MTIYTPYTYLIGWTAHNKFYYGVRYAKNCNPIDLWKTYFTSSKYVKQARDLFGEPDIIQIRKTFKNSETAILWETKVLNKMNVLNDERFLNKNIAGAISDQLISEDRKNRIWVYKNNENKFIKDNLLQNYLSDGWVRGRLPMSNEQKEKLRKHMTGKPSPNKGKRLNHYPHIKKWSQQEF